MEGDTPYCHEPRRGRLGRLPRLLPSSIITSSAASASGASVGSGLPISRTLISHHAPRDVRRRAAREHHPDPGPTGAKFDRHARIARVTFSDLGCMSSITGVVIYLMLLPARDSHLDRARIRCEEREEKSLMRRFKVLSVRAGRRHGLARCGAMPRPARTARRAVANQEGVDRPFRMQKGIFLVDSSS